MVNRGSAAWLNADSANKLSKKEYCIRLLIRRVLHEAPY